MNVFQLIKEKTDFLEVLEHYIGPLKQIGDGTYTTEEDECPIHGGNGCFRIKHDGESSLVTCFGNCDHDEWPLDIIGFVQVLKELDAPLDAVKMIADDFKIVLPRPNAAQAIFNFAADYYRGIFDFDTTKHRCLGAQSPVDYQLNVRHHRQETLDAMYIGWSDGGLTEALIREGFSREDMIDSGLVKEAKGGLRDYIAENSFIYPHLWLDRVSRFTFKNMNGKTYQVKKAHWLNSVEFFSVGEGWPCAVVEGENDLAALLDHGWEGRVLCSNGSLSKSQIEWIASNPGEYHTFFDGDPAGDKYTDAMWRLLLLGRLEDLHQWALPEGADIDSYLQEHKMESLKEKEPPERDEIIDSVPVEGCNVVEEAGIYRVIKVDKEGNESRVAISDFTVTLLYVKVQGDERSRVIRIRRRDGRKSKPIVVNSEAKVSLRHFRILVANAVDASFIGNEIELAGMWTYIYNRQSESVVDVPLHVGCMTDGQWLVNNQFIGTDGDVKGDEDNIMWLDSAHKTGIAPKSLLSSLGSTHLSGDIPSLFQGRDMENFIGTALHSLAAILKDPGAALTLFGWMKLNPYSMPLFYDAKLKFFPFMLLYGRHGKGKSTVVNWLLGMYDMADKGTTTVAQLRSGVGIERKLSYYRGLPYCIDELRADRMAAEFSKTWRGWYNRSSRVKGTRQSEEVIQVPLNANLFFCGQDTFVDPAMRSRCIPLKFPQNAGDPEGFTWMEDNVEYLPTIGYEWVRESMTRDIVSVREEIESLKSDLSRMSPAGLSARAAANYAMPGFFALELQRKYFPDYDYMGYMINAMADEHVEANDTDMVNTLWEMMAGLQIGDHPQLNGNHILVKDDIVHIWYAEVYRVCMNAARGDAKEGFSKGAIRDALVEEDYFAGNKTVRLGATQTTRRCLTFKLEGAPHELKAIAETAQNCF